jgi:hypothetical protein
VEVVGITAPTIEIVSLPPITLIINTHQFACILANLVRKIEKPANLCHHLVLYISFWFLSFEQQRRKNITCLANVSVLYRSGDGDYDDVLSNDEYEQG